MITEFAPSVPIVKPSIWPVSSVSANRNFVPAYPEVATLLGEVRKLTDLQEDWDGDGGLPVSASAASESIPWLVFGIEVGLVASVMPLGNGGLLAEWHYGIRLLQIEWSPIGTGDFDIAIDHDLLMEGPLPSYPQRLFSLFLDESRAALPS